ncbi:MAG: hypothetical protein AAGB34_01120 [Planctomycetota bacterium]
MVLSVARMMSFVFAQTGETPLPPPPEGTGGVFSELGPILLTAGSLAILLPLLLRIRRHLAAAANRPSPQERVKQAMRAPELAVADQTLVDLEALARESAAMIDNRRRMLEQLIHEADARISELRALQGESLTSRSSESQKFPIRIRHTDPTSVPAKAAMSAPAEPLPMLPAQVLELARQGLTNLEIAREVNQPPGQVELIRSLYESEQPMP